MCVLDGINFSSDVAKRINKFDIFICDLGKDDTINTINKTRPCVIVSGSAVNNYKSNMYQIAPIRTEHNMDVNENTIDHIVQEKRKFGKIYVPIEVSIGDWRFIDITQTKQIDCRKIYSYKYTIINEEVRNKINDGIYELYLRNQAEKEKNNLSDNVVVRRCLDMINTKEMTLSCASKLLGMKEEDLTLVLNNYNGIDSTTTIEVVKPKFKVNGKRPGRKPELIPTGFSIYYGKFKDGNMTAKDISEKMNMPLWKVYYNMKKYDSLQEGLKETKN